MTVQTGDSLVVVWWQSGDSLVAVWWQLGMMITPGQGSFSSALTTADDASVYTAVYRRGHFWLRGGVQTWTLSRCTDVDTYDCVVVYRRGHFRGVQTWALLAAWWFTDVGTFEVYRRGHFGRY